MTVTSPAMTVQFREHNKVMEPYRPQRPGWSARHRRASGRTRHFYLDLHSLILMAATTPPGGRRARKHVPPLPSDLPARERQRLLKSVQQARA